MFTRLFMKTKGNIEAKINFKNNFFRYKCKQRK